jgi:hypothetical protein
MDHHINNIFEKPLRKLQATRTSLLTQGKFIGKYDALLLATITVDGSDKISIPFLAGLNQLCSGLNDILNEAYIEQQTVSVPLTKDLSYCQNIFQDMRSVNSSLNISVIDNDSRHTASHKLKDLKSSLRLEIVALYSKVSKIADIKLKVMEVLKQLKSFYLEAIMEIAEESNILHYHVRASLVTESAFDALFIHKFFNTQVVSTYFQYAPPLSFNPLLRVLLC